GGAPGVPAPKVMVAAMGPRMIDLAGTRTDGVVLWLSGPRTIDDYLRPALTAAADRAERPAPPILARRPVGVTDDPAPVNDLIDALLAGYNDLPSYRGVMDREGVAGVSGVSIVGDEAAVRAGIARFAEAGTTDFTPVEFPIDEEAGVRTRA